MILKYKYVYTYIHIFKFGSILWQDSCRGASSRNNTACLLGLTSLVGKVKPADWLIIALTIQFPEVTLEERFDSKRPHLWPGCLRLEG